MWGDVSHAPNDWGWTGVCRGGPMAAGSPCANSQHAGCQTSSASVSLKQSSEGEEQPALGDTITSGWSSLLGPPPAGTFPLLPVCHHGTIGFPTICNLGMRPWSLVSPRGMLMVTEDAAGTYWVPGPLCWVGGSGGAGHCRQSPAQPLGQ